MTMRMLGAALLAVATLVGCDASGSPEAVARRYAEAVANLDRDTAASLVCESKRGLMTAGISLMAGFAGDDAVIDFSQLEYRVTSESGDRAIVHVSGRVSGTNDGVSRSEDLTGDVPLVREDGEWRVCQGL